MKDYLTINDLKEMLCHVAGEIIANEAYLTEIDNIIGDGDHGIGMKNGFLAVIEKIDIMDAFTINHLLKNTGMTMLDAMGGASGVLFGTMFISCYGAVDFTEILTLDMLALMLEKSLLNIKDRGKAQIGDKTMVDSLEPAVVSLLESSQRGRTFAEGLGFASKAARAGMENTKSLVASKGRAQSYGEKSLGTPDPGAVSVSIIFQAMYNYMKDNKEGEVN